MFDEYLGKPINVTQLERLFMRYIPSNKITYENSTDVSTESSEVSELSTLKSQLKGIDVSLGIANCGGKLEDYLKILKITYAHGEKQLSELKEAWEKSDYANYIICIHSLKSTSLNIGATGLSAMAKSQEEEGRAGNFAYIDKHMQEFQDDYHKLLEILKELLLKYGLITDETEEFAENAPELDETMVLRLYQNIERCIDQFDFAKVFDVLEETKKYKLPEKHRETLNKIDTLMEDLNVDEIREILHNL